MMTRNLLALALAIGLAAVATPGVGLAQQQSAAATMQGSPSKLVLDNSTRILTTLEHQRLLAPLEVGGKLGELFV